MGISFGMFVLWIEREREKGRAEGKSGRGGRGRKDVCRIGIAFVTRIGSREPKTEVSFASWNR